MSGWSLEKIKDFSSLLPLKTGAWSVVKLSTLIIEKYSHITFLKPLEIHDLSNQSNNDKFDENLAFSLNVN